MGKCYEVGGISDGWVNVTRVGIGISGGWVDITLGVA